MVASSASGATCQTLFDFTRSSPDGTSWIENSDTVKKSGSSKAVLVVQKGQQFQRAILFTLLNPRGNGTEFASVHCDGAFNIADFKDIAIRCRAQGANARYKMLLRHNGQNNSLIFGQVFSAPSDELSTIKLPINNFKPYRNGHELPLDSNPLEGSAITSIGLKIDRGPYLPDNLNGVAALEIEWIKATK